MNRSDTTVPSPTAPTVWKQRYEGLRQRAVGGRQVLESEPLGWVVLLRQGVAGWMRRWPDGTSTASPPSTPVPPPSASANGWQQQLTRVLAEMSLAHLLNRPLS
jgi:hypothetical protein